MYIYVSIYVYICIYIPLPVSLCLCLLCSFDNESAVEAKKKSERCIVIDKVGTPLHKHLPLGPLGGPQRDPMGPVGVLGRLYGARRGL